jgi:hypothetical protein
MCRRVFRRWALVLSALCIFANLPQKGGPLKGGMEWAGFPWRFAFWDSASVISFNPLALLADGAFWGTVVVLLPALCAWSRRGEPCSPVTIDELP